MAFSASEVAFEGFRLTREKPLAVAAWAGVRIAAAIAIALLSVFLIGPEMAALIEFNENPPSDPDQVLAIMPALLKVLAVGAPIGTLVWAIMVCAIYRAVLRPGERGVQYLGFGADEIRQILLNIVIALILVAAVISATFVIVLVSAGIGFLAGGAGAASAGLAMLITLLAMAAMIAVYVWLLVRLSLAGPMTLARGRIVIGEAWKLTRGHFWKLLGAYFLALVLAVVVMLLGWAIILAVSLAVGGGFGVMGQLQNPDFSSLQTAFSPSMVAMMVCSAILSTLQMVIMVAPTAVAYRELSGDTTVDTFA